MMETMRALVSNDVLRVFFFTFMFFFLVWKLKQSLGTHTAMCEQQTTKCGYLCAAVFDILIKKNIANWNRKLVAIFFFYSFEWIV